MHTGLLLLGLIKVCLVARTVFLLLLLWKVSLDAGLSRYSYAEKVNLNAGISVALWNNYRTGTETVSLQMDIVAWDLVDRAVTLTWVYSS